MLTRLFILVYAALLCAAPFTVPTSEAATVPAHLLPPAPSLTMWNGGYQVTFLPMMRFDSTSSSQHYSTAMVMRSYRADTSKMVEIPSIPTDTLLGLRIAFSGDSVNYVVTVRFYTVPGIVDTAITITHNAMGSTYKTLYADLGYLRPTTATWMDIIVTPQAGDTPVPPGPYGTTPQFYYPALVTKKA